MTLLLPTLAVAFAAFCVWLTGRIVNRKERWAKWMLAGVAGLPVLYVASSGPACFSIHRFALRLLAVLGVFCVAAGCRPANEPDPLLHALANNGGNLPGALDTVGEVQRRDDGAIVGFTMKTGRLTDRGLRRLREVPSLERLDIGGSEISDDALEHLESLKNLKSLNLRGCVWYYDPTPPFKYHYLTDAGISHLRHLSELEELDLAGSEIEKLPGVGELTKLRILNLKACRLLDDDGMKQIGRLKSLTSLRVGNAENVSNWGLAELATLREMQHLIISNSRRISGDGLAHLAGMVKMEHLELSDCPEISGRGLRHLAEMKHLQSLNLEGTGVRDVGMQYLAALNSLESLNLDRTHIVDESLRHIALLPRLKRLDLRLRLHSDADAWAITDAGMEHIGAMQSLEHLDLGGRPISDAAFTPLTKLKLLRELYVDGTRITAAGLAAARDALPECAIK